MTGVPRLQGPGTQNSTEPFADLVAQLVSLKRQVDDLSGSILKAAGLKAEPDLLRVLGSLIVEGNLSVPNGSIDNAALANPITPAYGYATASGYSIPVGQGNRVTRASFSLTVPSGFTKALITATSQDSAQNSTASPDYLNSYVLIGAGGAYAYCGSPTAPAGYTTVSLATMTSLMTGLTGGQTITIASQPYTTYAAWATASGNGTIVSATCLFLR